MATPLSSKGLSAHPTPRNATFREEVDADDLPPAKTEKQMQQAKKDHRRRASMRSSSTSARSSSSSSSSGSSDVSDEGDDDVYAEGEDFVPGGDVLISMSDLKELKDIMDQYEEQGGMEIDDFLVHFGRVARRRNHNITDEDLALIFMRVDANANASVDWEELSTYLLMSTEKEAIRQNAKDSSRVYARVPVEQDATLVPEVKLLSHDSSVRRILVDQRSTKYITHDDSTVKFWDASTLRHFRTPHYSRAAITATVMTPGWNSTVGVACMDSTLSFYSLETGDLLNAFIGQRRSLFQDPPKSSNAKQRHRQRDAARATAAMYRTIRRPTYTVGLNRVDEKRLQFAERDSIAGKVEVSIPLLSHFIKDHDIEATVLYDLGWDTRSADAKTPVLWRGFPTAFDIAHGNGGGAPTNLIVGLKSGGLQRYNLSDLHREGRAVPPMGLVCHGYYDAHDDWISKLKHVPQLDSIITSSWDHTLQVRHLERIEDKGTVLGVGCIDHQPSALWNYMGLGHARRVTNFDYHNNLKVLASCAAGERDVLVWSPYINRPLSKLEGGKGHLLDLYFCQNEVHLATISDDSVIKLWDLRTYRCVTTMNVKKPAALRASAHDDGPTLQSIAYDEKRDAIISAARQPLTWPASRNELVDRDFTGHRKPVISLSMATQFGQLISADPTAIAVWDVFTGSQVMRWELDASYGAPIIDAVIDHHQRRLVVALANGTVLIYNYINAFVLKRCLPPGVADAEFEEMLSKLPDLSLSELDAKAQKDLFKQQLMNRSSSSSSKAAKRTVVIPEWQGREGPGSMPAATCVCFATQVRPRHIFAIVTGTDVGKAQIHIDEDGGERQPQRIISTGGTCFATIPMGNSIVVFALQHGLSSYSLEEVGTKAQEFTPLPPVTQDDPLMCAIFEGELQLDPEVVFSTNELDREDSFADTQRPHNPSHRRSSGVLGVTMAGHQAGRRRSLGEYHKSHFHAAPPASPHAAGGRPAHTRVAGDMTLQQLHASQTSVLSITECAAPIYFGRHPACAMVASGTADGVVHLWHVKQQREVTRFRASTAAGDGVYCMTTDQSHNLLATGDLNGYLSIYDVSRVGTDEFEYSPVEAVVFLKKRWRAHVNGISAIEFITSSSNESASLRSSPSLAAGGPSSASAFKRPTVEATFGVPELVATSSTDCLVLLWKLDGTVLRSFGDSSGHLLPEPLPHAPAALATMDLVRTNELYAFIEEYEGCSIDDIFDEMLGEGHPFRTPDPVDDSNAPMSTLLFQYHPPLLASHEGDRTPTPTPIPVGRRRSKVTTTDTDDERIGQQMSTPAPPSVRSPDSSTVALSPALSAALKHPNATPSTKIADSMPLNSFAARVAAMDAEVERQKILAKKRGWTNSTRRAFAPGTYSDYHVGRTVRRVLRDMTKVGPGLKPCVIHLDDAFFIRTEEHEQRAQGTKAATATAAASPAKLLSGVSTILSVNTAGSGNTSKGNNSGSGGGLNHDGSMRFGRTAMRHMSDIAGLMLTSAEGSQYPVEESHHALTEVFREPRHVANYGVTPRVQASPQHSKTAATDDDSNPKEYPSDTPTNRHLNGIRLVAMSNKFNNGVASPSQVHDLSKALDQFSVGTVEKQRRSGHPGEPEIVKEQPTKQSLKIAKPPPTRQQASRDTWRFVTAFSDWHATPRDSAFTTPLSSARSSNEPPRFLRNKNNLCSDPFACGFETLLKAGTLGGDLNASRDDLNRSESVTLSTTSAATSVHRTKSTTPMLPPVPGATKIAKPPNTARPVTTGSRPATPTNGTAAPTEGNLTSRVNFNMDDSMKIQRTNTFQGTLRSGASFVSRRAMAASKVRKQLSADASGDDTISRALRAALDDREAAIADLARFSEIMLADTSDAEPVSPLRAQLSMRTRAFASRRGKEGQDLLEGLTDEDFLATLESLRRGGAKSDGVDPKFIADRDDVDDLASSDVSGVDSEANDISMSEGESGDFKMQHHHKSHATPGAETDADAKLRRARLARKRRRRRGVVNSMAVARLRTSPDKLNPAELEAALSAGLEDRDNPLQAPMSPTQSIATVFVNRLIKSLQQSEALRSPSKSSVATPGAATTGDAAAAVGRRRSEVVMGVLERATELTKELTANIETLAGGRKSETEEHEEWETNSIMSAEEKRGHAVEQQLARAALASAKEKSQTMKRSTHGMLWVAQTHTRLKLHPPADPEPSPYFAPERPLFAARTGLTAKTARKPGVQEGSSLTPPKAFTLGDATKNGVGRSNNTNKAMAL